MRKNIALITLLITPLLSCITACSNHTGDKKESAAAKTNTMLAPSQKMDTAYFWAIMDNAFVKGGLDNALREQAILGELIRLTPDQIQEFEIIFQQMNKKASTWGNFAAQTVIQGGSSDDQFYYFRCWLISLGQKHFEETVKNPDHLASFDIPVDKKHGIRSCQFEELISMADRAYEMVTRKNQANDTSFPRSHADRLGLFYDSNTELTGKEWTTNEELTEIVPLLCKRYPQKRN